jgi:hypothetical protein
MPEILLMALIIAIVAVVAAITVVGWGVFLRVLLAK